MKQSLSKKKKIFGYVVYGFLLTITLLYYKFPSEVFSNYIQARANESYPDLDISIEQVDPLFPFRLKFQSLEISKGKALKKQFLSADSLTIRPRILPLFKGDRLYNLDTSIYGGEITGVIQYYGDSKEKPMSTELELKDIHIEKNPYISEIIGRRIEGVLEGSINYKGAGNSFLRGSGDANLKLSNGILYFRAPVLGFDNIDFDQFIIEMALKNQRITFSRADFKSPKMQGSASGTIFLRADFENSRIDLQMTIEPYPELINELGSSIDTVKTLLKNGKFTFFIRGTINNPRINFI